MTITVPSDPKPIIIDSEDKAFEVLQETLKSSNYLAPKNIDFSKWHTLAIKYKGQPFHGTINSDIASAIVQLQSHIYNCYALLIGKQSATELTAEQKKSLQLVVEVKKGSSDLEADLLGILNNFLQAAVDKMTGEQITIVVIVFALSILGYVCYKLYVNKKLEESQSKERLNMSELELEKIKAVMQLKSTSPIVEAMSDGMDDVRQGFIKAALEADNLSLQGVKIEEPIIKKISGRKPRQTSKEVQLNGQYQIFGSNFSGPDEIRFDLQNFDQGNGRTFVATISNDDLTEEFKKKLQQAEWDRTKIYLAINATILRDKVISARIIDARWPNES